MVSSAKHVLARIGGNFGVSFFGPLVAGNVAETLYNIPLSFADTILIALIASSFQTGLVISKEVQAYGERR